MRHNRSTGKVILAFVLLFTSAVLPAQTYKVVDTRETQYYDTSHIIPPPLPGTAFYGQDARYNGFQPSYTDNGNGTISDNVTGLMWQKQLFAGKYTYDQAKAGADTFSLAGYTDWRLPTIKELYSLILFDGICRTSAATSVPYIDTNYFPFRYGFENLGERFIDAQYASATEYVGTTMGGDFTIFGVNFADGRIKGYGLVMPGGSVKTFEVRYVRGNTQYGINFFTDNGNGTITDAATGLMWQQDDSRTALNWQQALEWVQQKNTDNYLGHTDWRMPNSKELQSIVDYTRSPQTTSSAAINPLFFCNSITDEGGHPNFPFYWANTTHADGPPGQEFTKACYVCFGQALGWMEIPPSSGNYVLQDVHGAGAQRSDFKQGNPASYPHGHGPQGDVVRIYNYVRLVRDADSATGLNEINQGKLLISPNPASGYVNICPVTGFSSNFIISISDVAGRTQMTSESASGCTRLDISALPIGLYLVRINIDGMNLTGKFSKVQ